MEEKDKNKLQIIINDGIVYKKKDMLILLRDLGKVSYYEITGDGVKALGKGYIMRLCSNSEEPSLFLHGRIYINVSAFDFLKLKSDKSKKNTIFELHSASRIMRLVPEEILKPFPSLEKDFFGEKTVGGFVDDLFPPDDLSGPPDFMGGGGFIGN
ncbi:MAG: hypothetical protein KKB81_00320 [Candidatus Margulisbacteria bacterium]|nr:hypothetical protein [Candidatus Margulisiibacteriota bacterium]MBU1022400.1 hypothetical protein [Candidatus Margulisiibacteriota bacterium]MBU1729048.1 hypothetical protein [Candidatus Margulisiibacteriota bacterium]MBU1954531.1 hypothetical protein [Candidatus Margulisiibacteriota bacterium]